MPHHNPVTDDDILQVLEKCGHSNRKAGEILGINESTIRYRLKRLKSTSVLETLQGFNPEFDLTHPVAPPHVLKGVSTLYGKEGDIKLQWVKTKLDNTRVEEAIKEWIRALSESVSGLSPLTEAPLHVWDDILCVYPLGDPHFGMYAWAAECGEDFDLAVARRLTLAAIDRLISSAPAAKIAIILPLGDVFHADDQSNTTPAHHNQLDVDTRHVKVLGVGIETFRHAVIRALEKHDEVIVRFVAGNHDPHSIWALAFTISAYFSNEPRVTVDLSPSLFWFYRFGNVLIGATHGDKVKGQALLGVMAADQAKNWGETKHRYWYTGHIHTQTVQELPGVVLESFRTLAARDAYAAGNGYRAGRDMRCIVHHKEHGEIERHRCDIGMIQ